MSSVNIKAGRRYKITSLYSNLVVDLDSADDRSIIGWEFHGGDNQKVCTACFFNTQGQSVHEGDPFSGS
jgi:hypothetical protein